MFYEQSYLLGTALKQIVLGCPHYISCTIDCNSDTTGDFDDFDDFDELPFTVLGIIRSLSCKRLFWNVSP